MLRARDMSGADPPMSSRAKSRKLVVGRREIVPIRVQPHDQRDLLRSPPALDLLFSFDCIEGSSVFLQVNEPVHAVSGRERRLVNRVTVRDEPLTQVAGDSHVQNPVDAGHYVDVIEAHEPEATSGDLSLSVSLRNVDPFVIPSEVEGPGGMGGRTLAPPNHQVPRLRSMTKREAPQFLGLGGRSGRRSTTNPPTAARSCLGSVVGHRRYLGEFVM